MKQITLYISILLFTVFAWNAGNGVFSGNELFEGRSFAETSFLPQAQQDADRSVTVCVQANNYVDVIAQQSHSFSFGASWRYRTPNASQDRFSFSRAAEANILLVNTYKNTHYIAEEYAARQKIAGYYIYTLRRIII